MERITYQDLPKDFFTQLRLTEDQVDQSGLDLSLLELLRVRVAQINGCAYCVDMHHKELKHLGETDLRLSSICVWEEAPYFSKKEKAVLHFAETLTQLNTSPLSEKIFNELDSYFTKSEIAHLSLAISQINTWTRLMKVFLFQPGKYQASH